MDHRGYCVVFESVLLWVPSDIDGGFNRGHNNQPFKVFCDYQREGYGSISIQTNHCRKLGDRDNGGCFHASEDSCLDEGGVEDVCQDLVELISATPLGRQLFLLLGFLLTLGGETQGLFFWWWGKSGVVSGVSILKVDIL